MTTNTDKKFMYKNIKAQIEYIYMAYKSKEYDADWYGEFTYCDNPLEKYAYKSKLWDCKIIKGSSKGNGIAGIVVKTTLDNLNMLGWESDYEKYKCTKEYYDNVE